MKSWFAIDGRLPEIDFSGDSSCRYSEALVEQMLRLYSRPNDWVLDPFCGFGTTLRVCSRMNRLAVGFELEKAVYEYARKAVPVPSQLHHDDVAHISSYSYPKFNLVLTSPPFRSFRARDVLDDDCYYDDLLRIFQAILPALAEGAYVVVESVNLISSSQVIPRAFRSALALGSILTFEREYVCCNRSNTDVVPGYQHSYLLVFRNSMSQREAPETGGKTSETQK
jgi:SAM-dependent methyltransferase